MKSTPLTEKHIGLGAKMAEFAGYNMPISYTSIKEEHFVVRHGVGVFDVSHMGEFIVKGREALALLQVVTSNDVSKLVIGQAQYSCLPNHEGGIVDDLLVYRLPEDQCAEGENAYMLVVNAANIEKDWNWILKHQEGKYDTRLINISDESALLAVQGPKAMEVLQKLTAADLSQVPYYHFTKGTVAGIENVLISATGYTGAGGFELYVQNSRAAELWDAVFQAGTAFGILPVGLGARDTLRLEMGFCLYGNDITDHTSPLEAGLGWITKLNKGPFNSAEIFKKQKAEGVTRKLVGFVVHDRRVPRHDYPILNIQGKQIGLVTSGTSSPTLEIPIGMGYVETAEATEGNKLGIDVGSKIVEAEVVKLPFIS